MFSSSILFKFLIDKFTIMIFECEFLLLMREDFNTWGGLLRRSFMSQAKRDSIDYVIRQRRNASDQRLQNELQRQIRDKRAADSLEARFDSLVSLTPRQF